MHVARDVLPRGAEDLTRRTLHRGRSRENFARDRAERIEKIGEDESLAVRGGFFVDEVRERVAGREECPRRGDEGPRSATSGGCTDCPRHRSSGEAAGALPEDRPPRSAIVARRSRPTTLCKRATSRPALS